MLLHLLHRIIWATRFPFNHGFSETLLCGIGTEGRDHLGTTKFISREYGNRFSPAPKYSLVTVYKESVAADGGV